MKKSLLLLSTLFITLLTQAQNDDCIEKCGRANALNQWARATYYQYPAMSEYDVKYLKLDINAETGSRVISGNAYTVAKTVANMDTFITEFKSTMLVDSVIINGTQKTYTQSADHVFVPLSTPISAGSTFNVRIYYHGNADALGVYAGTVASNGLNYTASLSESYQAREWFPCKQILSDKIDSTDIWITTSAVNKAGSNGLLQGIDVLPTGKVRYRWKCRYPMNYYMPSFAVGNYMEYLNYAHPAAIAPDSILIQHYLVNNTSYFNSVKYALDQTPAFVEKLSELFGVYPFYREKYGHCMASIGGGMEHQTMTTLNSFGGTLVGHELGHQWFGDNVTCARWNDIWLNEGFASYSEYLLIEKLPALFPTTNPASYMLNFHNSAMSVANGSVYVPESAVFNEGRIFSSRLSYNKGAAIIHNLRFEMQSDTLFFNTLKQYQLQYKDSVATTEQFKQLTETLCGRSFGDFFNQWIYGEGYPTFNITYYKPTPDSMLIAVNETVSASTVTSFFKGYLELKITSLQGDTTILVNLAYNNQVFKIPYRKTPTTIVVDPNNWVLNQVGTITNGTVVPAKLISFKGNANSDCTDLLQWETANEINVIRYEIESSTDGIHFSKVGESTAKNLTFASYSFNTRENKKDCFYRLKMIENNGSFVIGKTIRIISNCYAENSMVIQPNPVQDKLNIIFYSSENTMATMEIYNETGEKVKSNFIQLKAGKNQLSDNSTLQLSAGVYWMIIRDSKGKISKSKFSKS